MSSLSEVRQALANVIFSGLAQEISTYPLVPDVAQTPAMVVLPSKCDFAKAFQRGLDEWEFDVFLLTSRTETTNGQDLLDEFCTGAGPNSIRQIIYENPTLGLSDTDAYVMGVQDYGGHFEAARIPHVGAILRVCVRTDGAQ
jgi:hypothetical protein